MHITRDINGGCAPESPTSANMGSSMGLNNLLMYHRCIGFGGREVKPLAWLREGVERKYLLFVLNDYKWGMREFEKMLLLFFKAHTLAEAGALM